MQLIKKWFVPTLCLVLGVMIIMVLATQAIIGMLIVTSVVMGGG